MPRLLDEIVVDDSEQVQQTGNFPDDKLGLTPKFKKIDTTVQ